MEPNGLGGGLFPGMSTSGMLGLELPQNPSSNNSQNPPTHPAPTPHHHNNLHHHPQLIVPSNNRHEPPPNHHSGHHHHHQSQPPPPVKYPYSTPSTKTKQHSLALSDEDEPGLFQDDVTTSNDSKNRKISPWQRMKWTDTMVRLLIMAVFYIGDDQGGGGPTTSDVQLQIHNDPSNNGSKKKSSIGLLQKKGKWKSVSHAMLEKGFYVSPQQCEDKFNDLNKRYKRVNDILGKGTACRVVENQSLLDSMDNLTPKMKDEVRKLLNSKHLFFREMCAYHNSCGHNTTNTGPIAESTTTSSQVRQQQITPSTTQLQADQLCFHSLESNHHTAEEDEEEELDDDSEEDDEDDEEDEVEGTESRGHNSNIHHDQLDAYENEEKYSNRSRKRGRSKGVMMTSSLSMNQFSCEVMGVVQDGGKSGWEKKQWMKSKLIQLEEQQLGYLCQAFELEKQRMKWVKFSSKKERDMEKAKLENERRRLENERMVLLVRQKELELLEVMQQQHSSNKRGDPSSIS